MPVKKPKSKLKPKPKPTSQLKPLSLPVATVVIVEETVAEIAYTLYLRRGGEHGYDVEDWLAAERMIQERM